MGEKVSEKMNSMESDGATALWMRDVVVTYPDGYEAIHGVDLEVAAGDIVALLGPSGSGKSSLLRAVAGLEAVTRGEVHIWGRNVAGVPVHKRGCGMVFQDGQLSHTEASPGTSPTVWSGRAARNNRLPPRSTVGSTSSALKVLVTVRLLLSREVRPSAWRSPVPLLPKPVCCSLTNRSLPSIGICVKNWRWSCAPL